MIVKPKVLVVEDEYEIAAPLADAMRASSISVVGPVPTVDAALSEVRQQDLDGAVLDLNLHGEWAFAVADALAERRIPFVIATGYDSRHVPAKYKVYPRIEKPYRFQAVVDLWRRFKAAGNCTPSEARKNLLLASLSSADLNDLLSDTELITLQKGTSLHTKNAHFPLPYFFLTSGVAVCEAQNRARASAAIGLVSRDGAVVPSSGDAASWPKLMFRMLVGGAGVKVPADRVHALCETSAPFKAALQAFNERFLLEVAQTLVGSAQNTVEQRVAHWLLLTAEKSESPSIRLTHEDVAHALAVRRPGVTSALNALRLSGYVDLGRGEVTILSADNLASIAGGLATSAPTAVIASHPARSLATDRRPE